MFNIYRSCPCCQKPFKPTSLFKIKKLTTIKCKHCNHEIGNIRNLSIFALIAFGVGLNYTDLLIYFFGFNKTLLNIWLDISLSFIVMFVLLTLIYYVFPLKCYGYKKSEGIK